MERVRDTPLMLLPLARGHQLMDHFPRNVLVPIPSAAVIPLIDIIHIQVRIVTDNPLAQVTSQRRFSICARESSSGSS
jgi:hypothetical protein